MNEELQFEKWGSIARFYRPILITEKIDGTNAHINIIPRALLSPQEQKENADFIIPTADYFILAGSRKRYLSERVDNFGFYKWVSAYASELSELGPGRHYGEWWGSGIQRGYGLPKGQRRFSLFNVFRYTLDPSLYKAIWDVGVEVVPLLYAGDNDQKVIDQCLLDLATYGSKAAPGYDNPEGIVIFHTHGNNLYKITIDGDQHKHGGSDIMQEKIEKLQEVIK